MYKAIQAQTGEEIIILHPLWLKRMEQLRALDHADLLICQGCRQSLRVKAGEVKRPHFAHKHLKACSYGSESPEILNARAVLYDWLFRQYHESVTVEKRIEGLNLPRPIDCWVETASVRFVYWVVEAGIKVEPREVIGSIAERLGMPVHFVFLQSMLHEEKKELFSLLLTPTERAFLRITDYDQVLSGPSGPGMSLHYLDSEQSTLTTYRSLALYHAPNGYRGIKKTSRLAFVKADRANGEFTHPGEEIQIGKFQQKRRRLDEKRKRYLERESAWDARLGANPPPKPWGVSEKAGEIESQGPSLDESFFEPLPCAICGQVTTDYWNTFTDPNGQKRCRCRECLEREGGV